MESVIRGLVVYLFLLVVFRISGKRTLSEATTFDLVLLLIISETTQQAMVDNDHSMTTAALLILTLVGTSIALSLLKRLSPAADRWLEGAPLILVKNGELLRDRMRKEWVDDGDLLEAARQQHGLRSLDDIDAAVLERGGQISIIPRERGSSGA
jgi:uncharacterized membrane protein YcaP (DUF421 family)